MVIISLSSSSLAEGGFCTGLYHCVSGCIIVLLTVVISCIFSLDSTDFQREAGSRLTISESGWSSWHSASHRGEQEFRSFSRSLQIPGYILGTELLALQLRVTVPPTVTDSTVGLWVMMMSALVPGNNTTYQLNHSHCKAAVALNTTCSLMDLISRNDLAPVRRGWILCEWKEISVIKRTEALTMNRDYEWEEEESHCSHAPLNVPETEKAPRLSPSFQLLFNKAAYLLLLECGALRQGRYANLWAVSKSCHS